MLVLILLYLANTMRDFENIVKRLRYELYTFAKVVERSFDDFDFCEMIDRICELYNTYLGFFLSNKTCQNLEQPGATIAELRKVGFH